MATKNPLANKRSATKGSSWPKSFNHTQRLHNWRLQSAYCPNRGAWSDVQPRSWTSWNHFYLWKDRIGNPRPKTDLPRWIFCLFWPRWRPSYHLCRMQSLDRSHGIAIAGLLPTWGDKWPPTKSNIRVPRSSAQTYRRLAMEASLVVLGANMSLRNISTGLCGVSRWRAMGDRSVQDGRSLKVRYRRKKCHIEWSWGSFSVTLVNRSNFLWLQRGKTSAWDASRLGFLRNRRDEENNCPEVRTLEPDPASSGNQLDIKWLEEYVAPGTPNNERDK